jgi:hypothetical protein
MNILIVIVLLLLGLIVSLSMGTASRVIQLCSACKHPNVNAHILRDNVFFTNDRNSVPRSLFRINQAGDGPQVIMDNVPAGVSVFYRYLLSGNSNTVFFKDYDDVVCKICNDNICNSNHFKECIQI